ncbi:MAG: elongation factor G [Planctomycetales bacterium]|nr:elongation factor G [Planctomycetales bacterium]MBN8625341.1 elongation factor G [Planctomycetota bacterium]
MTHPNVAGIRNIAFCGHGAAGKSTLIEQMLLRTGAVKPVVGDSGADIVDYDELEKAHHHSIESHVTHCDFGDKYLQLIDTPGYPDFIGQTIGALHGVDTAVIVVNAHAGLEVNTRRTFSEAGKRGLGRLIVINKMDAENIDFPGLLNSISEAFGHECLLLNVPIGSGHDFKGVVNLLKGADGAKGTLVDAAEHSVKLIESIIELDDEVTGRYFEGQQPTEEEISRLIVEAVATGHVIPILCTSAKTGVGITELLEALALAALPPHRLPHIATKEDGSPVEVKPEPSGPFVAQVFKTRIDPYVQKLSFMRIYSGTIKKDDTVHISGQRKGIKLHQLLRIQAGQTEPIESAGPGEIIAVAKTDELHTGTTLGDLTMEPIHFPTPMVGLAVMPKSRNDETKLSGALHKLAEEEPTLRLERDPQTHELVMNGMSELHLQLIQEKIKKRDKVDLETHEPKIPYRETVLGEAEGSYRHKKQSGGRGQFGEVHIRVYPLPEGTDPAKFCSKERFPSMREYKYDPELNFLWVDSIVGGTIPNNFLPAVEKGFRERIEKGVIAGYRVKNVAVEVFFGKHHPVDSSEAAFKTAGAMAFRNVFREARPALLEPIVKLHVTVPSAKLGDISSDMSGRRGRVSGMESAGGDMQTVEAEVPLSEVTTYARSLSSITGGQGSFTMEFSHYEAVPGNVQKQIIDKAAVVHEEEEVEV